MAKMYLENTQEGMWPLSHIKATGMIVENFEKKTLRGTKILFCGRSLNVFHT